MSCALKVKLMIIFAVVLVFPFSVFEIYVVFKLGFVEPYSYFLSMPIVVFFFCCFAVCYWFWCRKGLVCL